MMKNVKLMILIVALFQLGCTEQKIENYDIATPLKVKANLARKSQKAVKMELCNLASFNWDKIIVVRPYSTKSMIRGYKLENSEYVEDNLLGILSHEEHSLLLFIEQNKIVRYSYVPREIIDFCYINNKMVSEAISRTTACQQLYVKEVNLNLKLYL